MAPTSHQGLQVPRALRCSLTSTAPERGRAGAGWGLVPSPAALAAESSGAASSMYTLQTPPPPPPLPLAAGRASNRPAPCKDHWRRSSTNSFRKLLRVAGPGCTFKLEHGTARLLYYILTPLGELQLMMTPRGGIPRICQSAGRAIRHVDDLATPAVYAVLHAYY